MSNFVFINSDVDNVTVPAESLSHITYYDTDIISLFFKINRAGGEGSMEVRLDTTSGNSTEAIEDITSKARDEDDRDMIYKDSGSTRTIRTYKGIRTISVGSEFDSTYVTGVNSILYTNATPATVAAGVPTGGEAGQIIIKNSTTDYDTVWGYNESMYLTVENDEGSQLGAGVPVYAKGISGDNITVGLADANDSAKMPAIGVTQAAIDNGSTDQIITSGFLNVTVSGLTGVSVGDTIYVSNTGTLTNIKPTNSTDLVQNIGVVLKTNGSNIQKMKVSAIDRTNDIPNIASGKFFLGGATGQISPYTLPLADGTNGQVLTTNGSGQVTFADVTVSSAGALQASLSVNNSIGDAVAGTTYSSGTDIEDIIRDLLAPFTEPTIVSLTVTGTGTAGEDYLSSGNDIIFPANTTSTIDSIVLQVTDYANLENGITIVNTSADPDENIVNNASYTFSGNSSTFSSVSYSPTNQSSGVNVTVVTTLSYLGDDGEGSAVNLTLNSFIRFRDPWYVYAYSAENPSISTLTSSGTKVTEKLTMDPGSTLQELDFDCTSDTVNTSNYTFLVIPAIFAIDEIAASVSGRGVADYTDSFTLLGSSYSYNSSTYKIYRSRQTGAFDSDVTLHLTISKP